MGEWRKDQSKKTRRYIWGETRGQNDETLEDFVQRSKHFPVFSVLRFEKLGSEIHGWRNIPEDGGETYWTPCIRFVDDGWGYWTTMFRTDEGRWRPTDAKKMPLGRAIELTAEWYATHF